MAMDFEVTAVTALVTSGPREKQTYEGRGDNRKVTGRAVDVQGRPVSTFSAVVVAQPIGLVADAQIQLPDAQMTGLEPGAVVRIEGYTTARLSGAEYAAIRATITGEYITPVGSWVEWVAARQPKPSDKAA